MYSPQVIHLLQEATRRGDYKLFKEYTALVDDASKPHTLRGLMEMQYLDTPIPLDEVESVDSIVKRFKTGAMSFGSISAGGPRVHGGGHEHPGGQIQLRGGRRRPRAASVP